MTTRFQQAFHGIERPFAWLDLDALDDNIATVQQACGQKNPYSNKINTLGGGVAISTTTSVEYNRIYDIYRGRIHLFTPKKFR